MGKSINLYKANTSKQGPKRSANDVALYVVLSLLVLALLSYGGLLTYNKTLEAGANQAQEEARIARENIDEAQLFMVNDNYLRIEQYLARDRSAEKMVMHFDMMEQLILPEVSVEEYRRDNETEGMLLTINADFLDGASKQLTAFRDSERFSSIRVTSMELHQIDGLMVQIALVPKTT